MALIVSREYVCTWERFKQGLSFSHTPCQLLPELMPGLDSFPSGLWPWGFPLGVRDPFGPPATDIL